MAEMAFVWNNVRPQLKRVCLNYIYVFKLLHQTPSGLGLKQTKNVLRYQWLILLI